MKLSKLAMATLFAASVVPFGAMADNTGTITFEGQVVNTPCNIKQESLKQTVQFGQLSRKALEDGKAAEADFAIEFTGCDFNNFDNGSGSGAGPVTAMELTFTGQSYADTAKTMLASSTGNTNNLGVSIDSFDFEQSKDVLSQIVNKVGDNTLAFKAIAKAVDITKPVAEGKFSAISNFRITYQ